MKIIHFFHEYLHSILVTEPNQPNNGIASIAKGDWPDAPSVIQTFNHSTAAAVAAGPINDISNKLDQLMEIIQTQNCQISELRNEVIELKKSHSSFAASASASASKTTQNTDLNTQKIEQRLSRIIEEYLSRYEREHSKRLETFMIAR